MRPYGGGPTRPIRIQQPIYREQHGYLTAWRVGLNRHSGLGQYPEANGVYGALSHVQTKMVQIVIWGTPAFTPRASGNGSGSDDYDRFGAVTLPFTANTLDAVRALFAPGGHVAALRGHSPGLVGGAGSDPFLAEWVSDVGDYDFTEVWSVSVVPLP